MAIDGIRRAFERAGRASAATDVNDELSFHLARRIDELVARGMSPDDARREAMRAFGDVDHVRHELERLTRARQGRVRRGEWLTDLVYDVRVRSRHNNSNYKTGDPGIGQDESKDFRRKPESNPVGQTRSLRGPSR